MSFLRSPKTWRIAAIVVALVVVVAGGYFAYTAFFRSEPSELTETQQLVPVRRGDLITTVSISGSVDFPENERLSFGTAGIVEEVLVEEGQRVAAGDRLASLDPETIVKLEQEVAQANIDLRDASDALRDFLETPALTMVEARQAAVNAASAIETAEDALDAILNPSNQRQMEARAAISAARLEQERAEKSLEDLLALPSDLSVAQAQARVAAARLTIEQAEEALEDALAPLSDLSVAQAQARVDNARVAMNTAQAELDDYMEGIDTPSARRSVEMAETTLENAERNLRMVERDAAEQTSDTEDSLDKLAEEYADQFPKWLGIKVDPSEVSADHEAALSALGVDLDALFASSNRVPDLRGLDSPLPADDPSTSWNETVIFSWINTSPIKIVATCDEDDEPPFQGVCVEDEFRTRGKAYSDALDDWEAAQSSLASTLATSENAVLSAEGGLEQARKALEDLTDDAKIANLEVSLQDAKTALDGALDAQEKGAESSTSLEIEDMRAKVALAEKDLADAVEALEELTSESREIEVADTRERIALARTKIEQAEKDMEELLSGEDHPDYAARLQDVETARQTLAEREKDIAELLPEGRDTLQQTLLERNVTAAQAGVSEAEKRLADASLTAPWDGFVSEVSVKAGEKVEATTLIVDLVDTGVVEIDGSVDEVDVLLIETGTAAEVTLDALPGQTIPGSVSFIDAQADSQQGIVSYGVRVRLDMPEDLDIPKGLSAVASITVSELRDVLLVPQRALRGPFNAPTLNVMVNGEIVETAVELGEGDDFEAVIVSGVSEGDMVVIESSDTVGGDFFEFDEGEEGAPPGGNGEGPRGRREQ